MKKVIESNWLSEGRVLLRFDPDGAYLLVDNDVYELSPEDIDDMFDTVLEIDNAQE